jgi:hypothetical protein
MRHFALVLLITVALPATAQAPEAKMRYMCRDDRLIVQIAVPKKGVYTMVFPSDVCGPSV